MSGVPSYAEYRDSGVPWLGRIPAHWGRVHGGAVLQLKCIRNRGMIETTVLSLSYGRIIVKPPEKLHGLVPESFETYQIVDPGDIVVRPTDLQNDWNTIRVGLAEDRGIITSAYICFRAREPLSSGYAHLLLLGYDLKKVFYGLGSGLRQNLEWSDFKRMPLLLPPQNEQQAIVRFVHGLDGNVNRYIRNRRRQIEVLNEQKRAIIHRAATRGLDESVSLKPSGIDWLGDIPQHWEVWKIGHFAKVGNGSTPSRTNLAYWADGSHPWLNSSSVNKSVILRAEQFVTSQAVKECHLPTVAPGSVVVAITGQGRTRGTAAVVEIATTINQHLAYITPHSTRVTVNSHYLRAFLAAAYPELRRMSDDSGSTKGALTCGDLRAFKVALPPYDEQIAILHAIEGETKLLSSALARAERQIALIREYRSRLIADVVTGRADVSQAVAGTGADASSGRVLPADLLHSANIHFKRAVFAAEIIHRLHCEPTFGHVKFEKLMFLCEKRCGVDTGSRYRRQAAGPYDSRAIRSIDNQISKQHWYRAEKKDGRYKYIPLEKAGGHHVYFNRYYSGVASLFESVIEMCRTWTTQQCEIVATLYSAWSDLLTTGQEGAEDLLVEQVLRHWHASKLQIEEDRWRRAIRWMKKKGFTPSNPSGRAADTEEAADAD